MGRGVHRRQGREKGAGTKKESRTKLKEEWKSQGGAGSAECDRAVECLRAGEARGGVSGDRRPQGAR